MLGTLYAIGNTGAWFGALTDAKRFFVKLGTLGAVGKPLTLHFGGGCGAHVGAICCFIALETLGAIDSGGSFGVKCFCPVELPNCWSAVVIALVLSLQMELYKIYKYADTPHKYLKKILLLMLYCTSSTININLYKTLLLI